MYRKTNIRNKKTKQNNKNRTIKKKKGGKQYNHRRVGLYFTNPNTSDRYQINCEVCRNNDYIERPSTIGKTKGNQIIVNFLLGDGIFEDMNNISITTYFCRICGMSKIVRDDGKKYINPIPIVT